MKMHPWVYYGWTLLAMSAVSMFIIYGLRYSFSVFYVSILNEFGWSRADTALIFSVNVIIYGLTAPVAGGLVDRFGPRVVLPLGALLLGLGAIASSQANAIWQFMALYGVVMALGISAAGFVPHSAIIANWFVRKRGAAFAILTAGFGASYLMGTVAQGLISTMGWRNAFIALGLLMVVLVVPLEVLLQRRHPRDKGLLPDGDSAPAADDAPAQARQRSTVVDEKWVKTEWNLKKALKTYRFWGLFAALFFMWGMSINLVIAHQVIFAVDIGFTGAFAASIYGMYGVAYASGNLCGFISDRIGREVTVTVGIAIGMLGIGMLFLASLGHPAPWMLYFYSIAFGFGGGLFSPSITASVADLFQGKHFGAIYGFTVMGFGIGGAFSPWLGGLIHDLTGSYSLAFGLVIFFMAIAALSVWIAAPRRVRRWTA